VFRLAFFSGRIFSRSVSQGFFVRKICSGSFFEIFFRKFFWKICCGSFFLIFFPEFFSRIFFRKLSSESFFPKKSFSKQQEKKVFIFFRNFFCGKVIPRVFFFGTFFSEDFFGNSFQKKIRKNCLRKKCNSIFFFQKLLCSQSFFGKVARFQVTVFYRRKRF